MLQYVRPVTQNTIRWVPASFRVVLLIVIYYIYVVFIQVVTGSCALIFIVIAENGIRNISHFFEKKYVIIRYFLGCKNANLCI